MGVQVIIGHIQWIGLIQSRADVPGDRLSLAVVDPNHLAARKQTDVGLDPIDGLSLLEILLAPMVLSDKSKVLFTIELNQTASTTPLEIVVVSASGQDRQDGLGHKRNTVSAKEFSDPAFSHRTTTTSTPFAPPNSIHRHRKGMTFVASPGRPAPTPIRDQLSTSLLSQLLCGLHFYLKDFK